MRRGWKRDRERNEGRRGKVRDRERESKRVRVCEGDRKRGVGRKRER